MNLSRPEKLIERLQALQHRIRQAVLARRDSLPLERISEIVQAAESDVKFDIDCAADEQITAFCERWASEDGTCFILVAEGISETPGGTERMVFPRGAPEDRARFVLVIDPIDGTRELMYDKRSAWSLAGIAPYRPEGCTLADIEIAVQTELPPSKQMLADTLVATADTRTKCERLDLRTGRHLAAFHPTPSAARSLEQGFASVAKFFPCGKELMARIESYLAERLVGPASAGRAAIFDDQYISTGGQLYELMMGHDRFIADLRPLAEAWLARRGAELGLCAHPYDLCTELIARRAGVEVTTPDGRPLTAPLNTTTPVAWVGYANPHLRRLIEPHLQEALKTLAAPNDLPRSRPPA